MVNITARLAKIVYVVLYTIIFGIVELATNLDKVVQGEKPFGKAIMDSMSDLFRNGFINSPALLGKALQLFENKQYVMGSLRFMQFFMFIIVLSVALSLPAYGLAQLGLQLGFFGLLIWATMNTFILSAALNGQIPGFLILPDWAVVLIILLASNAVFLTTVYYWGKSKGGQTQ